jgi:hypothetical protein
LCWAAGQPWQECADLFMGRAGQDKTANLYIIEISM